MASGATSRIAFRTSLRATWTDSGQLAMYASTLPLPFSGLRRFFTMALSRVRQIRTEINPLVGSVDCAPLSPRSIPRVRAEGCLQKLLPAREGGPHRIAIPDADHALPLAACLPSPEAPSDDPGVRSPQRIQLGVPSAVACRWPPPPPGRQVGAGSGEGWDGSRRSASSSLWRAS